VLPATDPTTAEPAQAGTAATNPRRIRHTEKRTVHCLLNIICSPSLAPVASLPLLTECGFKSAFDFTQQISMTQQTLSSFFVFSLPYFVCRSTQAFRTARKLFLLCIPGEFAPSLKAITPSKPKDGVTAGGAASGF
jgi:hypothetical protein